MSEAPGPTSRPSSCQLIWWKLKRNNESTVMHYAALYWRRDTCLCETEKHLSGVVWGSWAINIRGSKSKKSSKKTTKKTVGLILFFLLNSIQMERRHSICSVYYSDMTVIGHLDWVVLYLQCYFGTWVSNFAWSESAAFINAANIWAIDCKREMTLLCTHNGSTLLATTSPAFLFCALSCFKGYISWRRKNSLACDRLQPAAQSH